MTQSSPHLPQPLGLLAELTHRCPLGCPYCSNPVALDSHRDELDTDVWVRVFEEAAALGVLQAHLSGGEPASRRDLEELVRGAHAAGLYVNLITSTVGISCVRLEGLAEAGVDHVQISFQDIDPDAADRIADYRGASAQKNLIAREVVALALPLTVNFVVHRGNIGSIAAMVEHAIALGAGRIEIAHAQYYGWALRNRGALMPTAGQVAEARAVVDDLKTRYAGAIVIDAVVPDYHARWPKPCLGGWGRRAITVAPSGRALPCHAAQIIPDLEFWSVHDHSLAEIWRDSPAFRAFRGVEWMQEPCISCARRERDFGGCRCQAFAIIGDARAADPVCHLSPHHEALAALAVADVEAPLIARR